MLALGVRANRLAAAVAGAAGTAVDAVAGARPLHRGPHQAVGGLEHGQELDVSHVRERPPRRDANLPQRLGLPDVADAGDEMLIEQRIAEPTLLWGR